jgi:ABC-type glycerol-3-phosphate transport system substrate-binding protein
MIPESALSKAQLQTTFVDSALPFNTPTDGTIAVPLLADPLVLYWNKDMLASAGYAQPPKYWDELFNMAAAITKKSDDGTIQKSAIALGEFQNIQNAKDIVAALILQAGGSITVYDSADHLVPAILPRSGEQGQATVSALRFFTEFADPSKNDYTWNRSLQNDRAAFAAGSLAMYVGYASEMPLLQRMNPNLNFAPAPLPQIRSAPNSLTFAHVYGLSTSRTSKNPTGAITAAFLLASQSNAAAISTALGIPSARRDVLSQKAGGFDDLFNKQAIISHAWTDPDPTKTANAFRAMIENTTSGAMLVDEAVQRADQQFQQIIGL